MIVESRVREAAKEAKVRVSPEFITALEEQTKKTVERAIYRARENARLTLQPQDL